MLHGISGGSCDPDERTKQRGVIDFLLQGRAKVSNVIGVAVGGYVGRRAARAGQISILDDAWSHQTVVIKSRRQSFGNQRSRENLLRRVRRRT